MPVSIQDYNLARDAKLRAQGAAYPGGAGVGPGGFVPKPPTPAPTLAGKAGALPGGMGALPPKVAIPPAAKKPVPTPTPAFGDKTGSLALKPGTVIIPSKGTKIEPTSGVGSVGYGTPAAAAGAGGAPVRPAWRDRVPTALNSAMERNLPGGVNQ